MRWCWRCQMEVPMLNEEEFTKAKELYGKASKWRVGELKVKERFNPLLEYYNELTAWNETEPNAIMHHGMEQYGADCPNCSKPLRTKKARYCAACGFGKDDFKDQQTKPLMERRKELFSKK